MKMSFLTWLRRWQFPLLLLLSVMPVALASVSINSPDTLLSSYILFAAYALLSGGCVAVPGSKRLMAGGISSVLMIALSLILLPIRTHPLLLLLPLMLGVLLMYSLPFQYESDMPPYVYVVGIGIHVIIQFLHHYFARTGGSSPYEPASRALTASFIGYVVLLLLSLNRISLDNASLARHHLPNSMRLFNTVLTLGFTALCLVLSALPVVIRAISGLWRIAIAMVTRLFVWLLSLLPAAAPIEGAGAGGSDMIPEFGMIQMSPSAFALLMQKIATVLSMVFLVGGSLFFCYLLGRQLLRLFRHLSRRLRTYMAAASSEFDDEITDTREDGAQRETHFTRRIRKSAVYDATPAGRIRQSYARLLRRHSTWTSSSTARENLPASAAEIYERARYSPHPVAKEDALRFDEQIRFEKKG